MTTVETIRDLGIPTLVGTVIGALIARYTAKARGREDQERAIELQAAQQRHAYELQVTQMSAGPRRQPLTTRACTQFGFSQAQARSG